MANNSRKRNNSFIKKIQAPLIQMQTAFNGILTTLDTEVSGSALDREREQDKLARDISVIAADELEQIGPQSGKDMTTFLRQTYNSQGIDTSKMSTLDDMFKADNNEVINFFQERYRNKYYLYDDLALICSQRYELREAISTTRDAIITSDDVSQSISRTLKFNDEQDESIIEGYLAEVRQFEKSLKLTKKIKDHIIPKSLQYGQYHVYTAPYSEVLGRYDYLSMATDKKDNLYSSMQESAFILDDVKSLTENFEYQKEVKVTNESILTEMNSYLGNISVNPNNEFIPIVESSGVGELAALIDQKKLNKISSDAMKGSTKKGSFITPDGVCADGSLSMNSTNAFANEKGCYIKLINPKSLIPIKVMNDYVIGYYWLREDNDFINKGPVVNNAMNPSFANALISKESKGDLEKEMVRKLTDRIVKSFNKKYLEENQEFKDLIVNSLLFDEMYKKKIKFQFIEKAYITTFSVNEDEEGYGTSILQDSLFDAKLYLALLLFKMITIISKSNDTRIYNIKNSIADAEIGNNIQRLARELKARQMNYTDLMSYNSLTTKVGANKEIFLPIGSSGEPAITFDILAGQDVPLHNELMETLRTNFINATGVPSVLMNYLNEADYAKTLELANLKFANRVINYQMDYNDSLSELYKKIMRFTTNIPPEVIETFEYKLTQPKALNNTNRADQINSTEQNVTWMVEKYLDDETDEDKLTKKLLILELCKEELPGLPWELIEERLKKVHLQAQTKLAEKELKDSEVTEE